MPDDQAQSEQSIPAIPVKKIRRRRTARKPVVPKIEVQTIAAKSRLPKSGSAGMLFVLLALLLFAGIDLYVVVDQYGSLQGQRQSWDSLMENYRTSSRTKIVEVPAPVPPPVPEKPAALYSVVQGESLIPAIESMVVEPLIDYHSAIGNPLKGIYVERKVATSKLIRVHLFLKDGSDAEFLWPFTGKETDWWIPECAIAPDATAKEPQCPVEFLYKYPAIAQVLSK